MCFKSQNLVKNLQDQVDKSQMCVQFYQLAVISFIELEFTYHKLYHYTYLIWWSFEGFEIMQSYMPSCDLVYWSKMGRFISWEFAFWPAKPVKEKQN